MAQPTIRGFVEDLLQVVELPDPIVEFGAMQVEDWQDGDLRPLFAGRDYVGTDMRAGPGVDRVEDLLALTMEDGSIGTALCLDTLEHCEDPPQACREMGRVVGEGGICVISSVMLLGIHGYPNDYFRFTPEGFRSMLLRAGFEDVRVCGLGPPEIPVQVLGVGAKRSLGSLELPALPSLRAGQAAHDEAPGKVHVGPFRLAPRELLGPLVRQAPRLVRERLRRR